MDMYGFYTGKAMDAYEYLGCHVENGETVFRTFAPAAEKISVIGEFNNWNETAMEKVYDGNFWECHIADAKPGEMYKYRIYTKQGNCIGHCDPYGFGMELRPGAASVIRDMNSYKFQDNRWIKKRTDCKAAPLNIYEIHVGSWKKKGPKEEDWYNYRELAELLIPYVKEKGYNYIELMPIGEHPCDNSWGYQQTGFYSPTARYGTADDLKYFIDCCHQNNVGVLLDFVPVHFAVDGYGLAEYDGTALYEYPNADVGYSEWGSKNFMHSRGEVMSFLQSCANYWVGEFHFDGIRIDALSNIIYWQGNKERGVNANAVMFIKYMNQELKNRYPGIILVAEDSTSYDGVTRPVGDNGLGFDYKWDMGWMNDTLAYFQLPPRERSQAYHKLTFSMMYYYTEHFLLPLSHDEVVHGKGTIVQKMNGEYEEKFSQARAFYMYMYAHPGKKLNFMGNEIGQLREWDERREQDWCLLEYPMHDSFDRFMTELSSIYMNNPALSEMDYEENGFQWIDCHQEEACVYVFERKSKDQKIIALFNFSEVTQVYELPVEADVHLSLLLASNEERFGGNKGLREKNYVMENGRIKIETEAFTGMYFLENHGKAKA